MNIRKIFSAASLLILALFSVTASALGEHEYVIEKVFDSFTPIFMEGHGGDMAWVEGFSFEGDIYFNGSWIGTVEGVGRLWNPPMKMGEVYDQLTLRITNTFPSVLGGGSFQVYAQGVTLGSSTTATSGDYVMAWSGTVTNGKGGFGGFFGTSAGSGLGDLHGGTATTTEIITLRSGF